MKFKYVSQYKQDKYLNEIIFKNKYNGTFVDVGAYDGLTISNTYIFEKYYNWKGICIEANPDVIPKLKENRNSIVVNKGVSDKKEIKKFNKIAGIHSMMSGFIEDYHHIQMPLIQKKINNQILDIECLSLMEILNEHNILDIDLLSIDVEGSEYKILKSLDFDKVNIKVIISENNYEDIELRNFLHMKNYTFIKRLMIDDVFLMN